MLNKNIFAMPATALTVNRTQIQELITFLVTHRDTIRMQPDVQDRIIRIKPLTKTPMSTVFIHAIDVGKGPVFALLNIPKTVRDVPEIVTYQHITIDVTQCDYFGDGLVKALDVTPFKNKLILNATPWVTKDENLSDSLSLHSMGVRDLLVRSYSTSTRAWISPQIARWLGKIYSMSQAALVSGAYNLTYMEQSVVAGIFAYFWLSKTIPSGEVERFFRASATSLNIARSSDVDAVVDLMNAHVPDLQNMTLTDVCKVLQNIGISRMSTISPKVLYTRAQSWGPDVYTSAMALEYPPYFVYLLLLTSSGRKTGLSFLLKKMSLDKDIRTLGDELVKAPGFLPLL